MAVRSRPFVWLFLALAGLPLLRAGLPREVAKFHIAASRNAEWDGDLPAAIAAAGRAIAWDPQEPAWRVRRAELEVDAGELEKAFDDLRRAERLPAPPQRLDDVYVEALLQAGRPKEALARWVRSHPEPPSATPSTAPPALRQLLDTIWPGNETTEELRRRAAQAARQNTLAYFRALAEVELDQALEDARQAVQFAGDPQILVDPRGYLLLSAGKSFRNSAAPLRSASLLQRAVNQLRTTTHRLQIRATALRLFRTPEARRAAQRRVEAAKRMLVSAYIELSREYAALRMDPPARQQLDWARRIGGEEIRVDDPAVGWNIELPDAIARTSRLAAYLDTLATVHWKRGDSPAALRQLGRAIELGEAVREAAPWWLDFIERQQIDVRQERWQQRELTRSLAIYYYRRSKIRMALGDEDGARSDQKYVRYLGFEPSDRLQ